MDYKEVLKNARSILSPKCRVCPVCDGRACRGEVPGQGGKGTGATFIRNVEYLARVKVVLDTLYEDAGQDTSYEIFGRRLSMPAMVAPIGGLVLNYGSDLGEEAQAERMLIGSDAAHTILFTGDAAFHSAYFGPISAMKRTGILGIPTIKPWNFELALPRIEAAKEIGVPAIAMDVDAAGLANVKIGGGTVYPQSVKMLRRIVEACAPVPLIVKGIMSVRGAQKALEAGAWGIVVSNHGGRVLDHGQATSEVLPGIRDALGRECGMKIFMDGGIRSGVDVFKAVALGADAVLLGRPAVVAYFGGGAEGVELYLNKIRYELEETMTMTGASKISDISRDMIVIPH